LTSKTGLLNELNSFLSDLINYSNYIRILKDKSLTKAQEEEALEIRDTLIERVNPISKYVDELGGTNIVQVSKDGVVSPRLDLWKEALKTTTDESTFQELILAIDTIKGVIGQLKHDIEHDVRNDNGDIIKPLLANNQPAKAFISHGKHSIALDKIELFLRDLGIEPLIVKDQASQDKTVDDKINFYLNQADCVVILATGDDLIDGKMHPRQNVIHEIGLSQTNHAGKIIYLLEEGAEFPSNISPKVWETFKQDNLENVFQRIVIELRAFRILQAVKPLKKINH
jgi:predicted nucleotide-binding protein